MGESILGLIESANWDVMVAELFKRLLVSLASLLYKGTQGLFQDR